MHTICDCGRTIISQDHSHFSVMWPHTPVCGHTHYDIVTPTSWPWSHPVLIAWGEGRGIHYNNYGHTHNLKYDHTCSIIATPNTH